MFLEYPCIHIQYNIWFLVVTWSIICKLVLSVFSRIQSHLSLLLSGWHPLWGSNFHSPVHQVIWYHHRIFTIQLSDIKRYLKKLMAISFSSWFTRSFQDMKNPSYFVRSLNISNKSELEFLKYVWNIIDDAMSSRSIVAMNTFIILWSGMDAIPWCAFLQIGWKNV